MKSKWLLIPSMVAIVATPFIGLTSCNVETGGGGDTPEPTPPQPEPEDAIALHFVPDCYGFVYFNFEITPNNQYIFSVHLDEATDEWLSQFKEYDLNFYYQGIKEGDINYENVVVMLNGYKIKWYRGGEGPEISVHINRNWEPKDKLLFYVSWNISLTTNIYVDCD